MKIEKVTISEILANTAWALEFMEKQLELNKKPKETIEHITLAKNEIIKAINEIRTNKTDTER